MRKMVVSEGMTLDGVFDVKSISQWALPNEGRDEFVRDSVLASDALLYGRTTYDLEAYYWPKQKNNEYGIADRMNSMPKYVVTSKPLQARWNNTTIVTNNVVEEIAKLKQEPGKDILIKGIAMLVEALMKAGLIDEYKFMVHPFIMGTGKHFFKDGMGMTKLKLVESKPIGLGVMALTYEPTK
jgi:dihydrofolate reductase